MDEFSLLHKTNIFLHVGAGLIALLLGIVILLLKKGDTRHRKMGQIFLGLLTLVVATAIAGVLVFGRNTFLLVLTVASGYYGYSGFRIARIKSNVPKGIDIGIAILSLCIALYFLYYIKQIGMIWSPIIIYATVGNLFFVILYDFLKYFIPKTVYANVWLYEHIYKLIAAFTALLSAAVGTVFPNFKPYSQFGPSVFGSCLAIGFIFYYWYMNRKKKST